ncbi:hypothetical protein DMB66_44645 [Actinoplanes sp. ATCC 53533]|uniref:hypothetical protein n=1 Tax=Actinoplanes sp. ATCC 53533 TaxID=1288362 RepID=UPI000F7798D3|nr:hypothetical protein [Actinoplanes sp. ATCC 53533]RSM49763.1 hypothetical protein DMB66_44645 [Actinoplanes sp. ATCC 53533]
MLATISRTAVAAVLGAGLALSATSAVLAAPAKPLLSITATDLTYGQPDLTGTRSGTNTVTITNNSGSEIERPMLTFPDNGRDDINHGDLDGCPMALGRPDRFVCYAEPLGAGETRVFSVNWLTDARGPAGSAAVRVAVAADDEGNPVRGTTSRTSYGVSFAPLTGTFDITATDLTYGPQDDNGVQHGSTAVTITNLTGETVAFPLVSFAPYAGDASVATWESCLSVYSRDDRMVCAEEPLGPGEQRTATFGFQLEGTTQEFASQVQVEAGAAVNGPVIPGTAAGTSYTVR